MGMFTALHNRNWNGNCNMKKSLTESSYLMDRICKARTLEGHEGCVNTVDYNSDGSKIISGSDDRKIKLWDSSTGKMTASFRSSHSNNVFQARFRPGEESTIISCAADGKVMLSCLGQDGKLVGSKTLGVHSERAHKLALHPENPNCLYSCAEDSFVMFYDLRCARPQSLMLCLHQRYGREHRLQLYSIHCNPVQPHQFAVSGVDPCVRVYDHRMNSTATPSASETCGVLNETSSMKASPVRVLAPSALRPSSHDPSHFMLGTHVTCAVYSNRGDILASYGGEDIYRFRAESSSFKRTRSQEKQSSGNKRERRPSLSTDRSAKRVSPKTDSPKSPTDLMHNLNQTGSDLEEQTPCGRESMILNDGKSSEAIDQGTESDPLNNAVEWLNQHLEAIEEPFRENRPDETTISSDPNADLPLINDTIYADFAREDSAARSVGELSELQRRDNDVSREGEINERIQHERVEAVPQSRESHRQTVERDIDVLVNAIAQARSSSHVERDHVDDDTDLRSEYEPDESSLNSQEAARIRRLLSQYTRQVTNRETRNEQSVEELEEEEGRRDDQAHESFRASVDDMFQGRIPIDSAYDPGLEHAFDDLRSLHSFDDDDDDDEDEYEDEDDEIGGRVPGVLNTLYLKRALQNEIRSNAARSSKVAESVMLEDDDVVQVYRGHTNSRTVKSVAFLGHDSEYVMSGSDCGHIFIWRSSDGQLVRHLKGDADVVNCLAQHPTEPLSFVTSGIEDDIKQWGPELSEAKPLTDDQRRTILRRSGNRRTLFGNPWGGLLGY